MRAFRFAVALFAFVAGIALGAIAFPTAQTPAPDAASVLASAREALGGEKRIAAVKTIVATGRTRQVRGDNLVPIEFEIASELPDKYVRKDEIPAQESGPTTVGFSGDALIQLPAPPTGGIPGRPGGPPPPTPEQQQAASRARANGVKQDFARLMLGFFAGSFSSYPLTLTYAGQAEAPQGMADVLDVKVPGGPANLAMRFFVYRDTHLPVMVTWQGAPAGPGRGPGAGPARGPVPGPAAGPGPAPNPGAAPGPGPAPGPATGAGPVPGPAAGAAPGSGAGPAGRGAAPGPENRLYFADYRDVNGLKLPFRLRRAVGPDTIEETTFDGFRINAKIDPKKFEVSK